MVGRLASVGALLAVLCAALSPVVFGGRTLSSAAWLPGVLPTGPVSEPARSDGPAPVRDVEGASWVDEPAPYLVHRGLVRGEVPLWNDTEGLGLPLLGNPNMGALSPLQLVVNLAPSAAMQDFAWLLRVLLLGVFTLGLARELGLGWTASLAAAIALMLSGQTLQWIEHHPLNTDVFVPAALWAALALRRTGRRGIALLAMAVGAGLLGVKPQSAILSGLVGLVWLVAYVTDPTERHAPQNGEARMLLARSVGAWVAGVALGAALAGVALVPFFETYEQASGLVRAGRTTQSQWTLPVTSLSSLGGRLAVELQHLPTAGEGAAGSPVAPGLPYAGLAVILGAALGFWATRGSTFTWVLGLTVVLEIARIHGLFPLALDAVPVLGSINYVKYCFPLYLALALLLARGVEAVPGPVGVGILGLVTLELVWLAPRSWAERVDPYAPAPWTTALHRLNEQRPGRMSGAVDLAPPLVSGALGFRDLRSIDVLTPRDTYDFVSRLIAPSRGVTWILADPDPLLAATGPGANVADLRWIVARRPLEEGRLPEAVRESTTSRRLVRLFDAMVRQEIETRVVGGGVHDGGRDRRFHWTCETPCRFEFHFAELPEHFVAGLAAPNPVGLRVRLGVDGGAAPLTHVPASRSWHDLWLHAGASTGDPGVIVLEIDSEAPAPVFLGGVGPAPSPTEEATREGRELAYRAGAFARLALRHVDDVAHVYENRGALGEAFFAARVVSVPDREAALGCVAENAGEAVACVPRSERAARDLPRGREGTAEVTASGPGAVRVRTVSEGDGVLVVSRLFDPGWTAAVDDAPAPLWRTNGALMALEVPAGGHDVELRYAPGSFRAGLGTTLLALFGVGVLLLPSRRRAGPAGGGRRPASPAGG